MNFAEALARPLAEIEKPKTPPVGTYDFQITKVPAMRSNDDFDFVDFNCQAVAASDEVDADDLKKFGGLKSVRVDRFSFMFSKSDQLNFDRTMFRLREFLEEHVKSADNTMSLKEALNSSINNRFRASTRVRTDPKKPENQYFEIDRTAPID